MSKIQDFMAKLPAQIQQSSPEAIIDLIDNFESSLYSNFLIDSLPYLLGEEYRKENLASMFTIIKNSVRKYKDIKQETEGFTEDNGPHPLSYLMQQLGVMTMFLQQYKHIPKVTEAVCAIDSLKMMFSGAIEAYGVTQENKNLIESTIDNGLRMLTSPDLLQVLESVGYNESVIQSQFDLAKNILKMRLFGSLDELSKEGEEQYKEANNGNPIC